MAASRAHGPAHSIKMEETLKKENNWVLNRDNINGDLFIAVGPMLLPKKPLHRSAVGCYPCPLPTAALDAIGQKGGMQWQGTAK
jgi:hypothetical protein